MFRDTHWKNDGALSLEEFVIRPFDLSSLLPLQDWFLTEAGLPVRAQHGSWGACALAGTQAAAGAILIADVIKICGRVKMTSVRARTRGHSHS